MPQTLPKIAMDVMDWGWEQFEPHYAELAEREISAASVEGWLRDWTHLTNLIDEVHNRLATRAGRVTDA
jgi:hypothetical protein